MVGDKIDGSVLKMRMKNKNAIDKAMRMDSSISMDSFNQRAPSNNVGSTVSNSRKNLQGM